jgi:alkanesulfonate monooxygenase SsuD/methylene tetrahydromethanopterin reductase-like flavin-dependent oxidoreductase (luciferase family)
MTYPLRFHVLVLPKIGWAELKARVLRLEELGVEVVALPDHFVDWTNPAGPWFETWSLLPALAEATSSIRISTSVTQIPLRNPAMLARQAMTVDHISGGRLEIGLGTGLTIDPSYDMAGLPNWTARERADRFGEYVEIVAGLLGQDRTSFSGRHYSVDQATMNPRPVQQPHPPLIVAALGPRMMRHAVKFADTWDSLSFKESFTEQLAEMIARTDQINAICAETGRGPETLRRSYLMFDANARHRGGTIDLYESPSRLVERVNIMVGLGVSDVGLYYPLDPAQETKFERILVDVLPELRATHAAVKSGGSNL